MEDKPYDVVLSFAGENRSYVNEVARFLKSKDISCFYDKDSEVELWGKNLMEEFDRIYRRDSRYAVLFVSEHYEKKMWPRHERRSALARALKEKREYVLPARFDDTEIDGLLPTTSYLDLRRLSPTEFAVKICQKIGKDISKSKLNAAASSISEESENISYPLVEVQVGTLRSNIVNYQVSCEVFRFRGKLLAEATLDYGHGATFQALYEKPGGRYLVYVEQDHRHDYWTSSLAGAMVGGESELPLSIEDVQERFPELATEARLSRITDI